jgi:hypothetical protein
MNQIISHSELAHNVRNNILSIIDSLKYVKEKIIEQDYDGALNTINLISEYAPDIANAMKELELILVNLE